MNPDGWVAGFLFGTAVSLLVNYLVRWVELRVARRRRGRCGNCGGETAPDGRAVAPIEDLEVCPECGDTWPGALLAKPPGVPLREVVQNVIEVHDGDFRA